MNTWVQTLRLKVNKNFHYINICQCGKRTHNIWIRSQAHKPLDQLYCQTVLLEYWIKKSWYNDNNEIYNDNNIVDPILSHSDTKDGTFKYQRPSSRLPHRDTSHIGRIQKSPVYFETVNHARPSLSFASSTGIKAHMTWTEILWIPLEYQTHAQFMSFHLPLHFW